MILIYAYGSGLGHLKRVSDFLQDENYTPDQCLILTNSEYATFWSADFTIIKKENSFFASKREFFIFFEDLCLQHEIDEIIVDVFPSGFYGELADCLVDFKGRKILLARILQDTYFIKNPAKPYFDHLYIMEKGVPDSNYVFGSSELYQHIKQTESITKVEDMAPYFLLIHSQPLSEVLYLYNLAKMYRKGQKIIIQTAIEIPVELLDPDCETILMVKTSRNLLEGAELIFSAGGYNMVKELLPYVVKCKCVPFPRTYDDQFLRKRINF